MRKVLVRWQEVVCSLRERNLKNLRCGPLPIPFSPSRSWRLAKEQMEHPQIPGEGHPRIPNACLEAASSLQDPRGGRKLLGNKKTWESLPSPPWPSPDLLHTGVQGPHFKPPFPSLSSTPSLSPWDQCCVLPVSGHRQPYQPQPCLHQGPGNRL